MLFEASPTLPRHSIDPKGAPDVFRAAILRNSLRMALSGPEHAHLSDAELQQHAIAHAARLGMRIGVDDLVIGVASPNGRTGPRWTSEPIGRAPREAGRDHAIEPDPEQARD